MYFCSKHAFMFACKNTGTTQDKRRFVEENIAGPWKLSTHRLQEPHQDRVPGREADRSPSRALTKHGTLSLWSFRCRNRGYTLSSCGTLWSRTPCDPGSDPGSPTARWRRAQRSGPCAGASGRQVPGRRGSEAGPQEQLPPSLSDSRRSGHQEPSAIVFRILARLQDGGQEGIGFISNSRVG